MPENTSEDSNTDGDSPDSPEQTTLTGQFGATKTDGVDDNDEETTESQVSGECDRFQLQDRVMFDGDYWVLTVDLSLLSDEHIMGYRLYSHPVCEPKDESDPEIGPAFDAITSKSEEPVLTGPTNITDVTRDAEEPHDPIHAADIPEGMESADVGTTDEKSDSPTATFSDHRSDSQSRVEDKSPPPAVTESGQRRRRRGPPEDFGLLDVPRLSAEGLVDISYAIQRSIKSTTLNDIKAGFFFTISEITPEPEATPLEKGIAAFVYGVLGLSVLMVLATVLAA